MSLAGPAQVSALQPDGKIVVATSLNDNVVANTVFGVLRYLPNGTIDASFGTGGVARTAFNNFLSAPASVAIQSDGKIIAAGSATDVHDVNQIALARYNADGTPDRTFGSGGKVTTSLLGNVDNANVVVMQPDAKILVGGSALTCFGRNCPTNSALVRYRADGTLDATFGQGGKTIVSGGGIGAIKTLALEQDGSILAYSGGVAPLHVSATGVVEAVSLGGSFTAIAASGNIGVQSNGEIVAGGVARGLGKHGFKVRMERFMLTGSPDPAFNSPIFAFNFPTTFNAKSSVSAIGIEANGKIVAGGGTVTPAFESEFGLARLNTDGSLDTTFGSGGVVNTRFSGQDVVASLLLQRDGKIIAVGNSSVGSAGNGAIALARYLGP